jgi:anti-anti-sigma factor
MPGNRGEVLTAIGHHALLTAGDRHRGTGITDIITWMNAARGRGQKVLTLGAPAGFGVDGHRVGALGAADLDPAGEPARLVRRAQDEGYRGVGVAIWADSVIGGSSRQVHAEIEAVLADLSRNHPVSVLCLYGRAGAGREHLDLAVTGHPDGLHEQQLDVRRRNATLHLGGEVDLTNLDVLVESLHALTGTSDGTVRIDLAGITFLGASGTRVLHEETAGFRAAGGRVEVCGTTPHLTRVLRLLQLDRLPGITLVPAGP